MDRKLNILILGSGGREHALACTCAKSALIGRMFVAPGNPGCADIGQTVPLELTDHRRISDLCREESIGLVVVGPEAPLVAGIADDLARVGVACFGPSRAAARLEGSKGFAKDFCREFRIPTGEYWRFRDAGRAKTHIREHGAPIVVKADGLAGGKGVIVAKTVEEAKFAVDFLLSPSGTGNAGLVLEEVLEGEEVCISRCATERPPFHLGAPRTTNGSARETLDPIRGGWGPIRRRHS